MLGFFTAVSVQPVLCILLCEEQKRMQSLACRFAWQLHVPCLWKVHSLSLVISASILMSLMLHISKVIRRIHSTWWTLASDRSKLNGTTESANAITSGTEDLNQELFHEITLHQLNRNTGEHHWIKI
ncbi:hypothetical protein Q8A67_011565 [Cirrhinus molitorella]|uniref:Uncharacterized protein n=1 Tax=Cirrhinus molitorella TaxID=172907 RepID=A0AA88TPS8_9TELE|nr:hypothetical protein Q8A67_011565 [Cirrhinus molitorella]